MWRSMPAYFTGGAFLLWKRVLKNTNHVYHALKNATTAGPASS